MFLIAAKLASFAHSRRFRPSTYLAGMGRSGGTMCSRIRVCILRRHRWRAVFTHHSPLATHSERSSPSEVRTHSLSSCQGWKRAAYSSDAARWRFGRKKGHRPIGPIAGGIAWGKTPGKRVRSDCGLPLGSGRLSHGVKARSAIGIELPWLLEHRLLSEAKGNHCADYLSS
jgi:hypothetical protein